MFFSPSYMKNKLSHRVRYPPENFITHSFKICNTPLLQKVKNATTKFPLKENSTLQTCKKAKSGVKSHEF